MRILLLVVSIIMIIACIVSLLYAALNCYGYYHVVDGSASLYDRLHRRMIIFFITGSVLAVIGAVCLIIRSQI